MSNASAKATLDPGEGEGESGYITASDVKAAIDVIYADMPAVASLPAGSVLNVSEVAGSYTRPTARADVCVIFTGVADPASVALDGDKWDRL